MLHWIKNLLLRMQQKKRLPENGSGRTPGVERKNTRYRAKESKPPDPVREPQAPNPYRQILSELQYVHKEPDEMLRRRFQAYNKLVDLGDEAQKAIPELIRKLFVTSEAERRKALETLERIDPQWNQHEQAEESIPYLISRLDKERTIVNQAVNVLLQLGPMAHPHLTALLNEDTEHDPLIQAYCLRILYKSGADLERFKPFILRILQEKKSMLLVETCLEAIQAGKFYDDQFIAPIAPLVDNSDPDIRRKAILALKSCVQHPESAVPVLIRPLTDSEEPVRHEAIEWLSAMDNPYVDDLMMQLVEQKGGLIEEDMMALIDQIHFFLGGNVIESFRVNSRQFWNNLSWQRLEMRERLEKQDRMLESALHVLSNRRYQHPALPEKLIDVYRTMDKPAVQNQAIRLMGFQKEEVGRQMAFLVSCLASDYPEHQKTAAMALKLLDQDWISHPVAQKELVTLVEQLDGKQKETSQSALLTIGNLSAPFLTEYLMNTNSRILQEAIIDVLDKLDNSADISMGNLLAALETCQNMHVRKALMALIGKLEDKG